MDEFVYLVISLVPLLSKPGQNYRYLDYISEYNFFLNADIHIFQTSVLLAYWFDNLFSLMSIFNFHISMIV